MDDGDGSPMVVVCPDKFRGSAEAGEAACAIAAGFRDVMPDARVVEFPLCDGGEGFAGLVADACGGGLVERTVTGPLGQPARGRFAVLPDGTAVVEMASASGLSLVGEGRGDPMRATSRGTGELIAAALDGGCSRLVLGTGGSATVDGGTGAASALGVVLAGEDGGTRPDGGASLSGIRSIDMSGADPRLNEVEFIVATDVGNPLLGPHGAARMYGPQKGASPDEVEELERGLAHLSGLAEEFVRSSGRALPVSGWPGAGEGARSLHDIPGTGSAGGMSVCMAGLFGATIKPGARVFMELTGFDDAVEGAALFITGEGSFDEQSGYGKVTSSVLLMAGRAGVPCAVVCGETGPGAPGTGESEAARPVVISLMDAYGLKREESMAAAADLLRRAGRDLGVWYSRRTR